MAVPQGLTADGYEIQFGTNHLGHALLIKHLVPTMLRTAKEHGDARIVCLTSTGFNVAPKQGIIFKDLHTTMDMGMGSTWTRYGQSKLSNLLYGAQLAKRYPELSVAVVHPGVIQTDIFNGLGLANKMLVRLTNIGKMKSPEEGAQNSLWAATVNRKSLESGAYYEPVAEPGKHSKLSQDTELGDRLWDWTQKELARHEL